MNRLWQSKALRLKLRLDDTRAAVTALAATMLLFGGALEVQAGFIGFTGLGDLPGGSFNSEALVVSADGLTVVGKSSSDISPGRYEAARWQWSESTNTWDVFGLGDLPGTSYSSGASSNVQGVSGDGSVIVGTSGSTLGQQAFLWTDSGPMTGLGDLVGGGFNSSAQAMLGDGSVVVGSSKSALVLRRSVGPLPAAWKDLARCLVLLAALATS